VGFGSKFRWKCVILSCGRRKRKISFYFFNVSRSQNREWGRGCEGVVLQCVILSCGRRKRKISFCFFNFSRSQNREWGRGCEGVVLLPGVRGSEGYIGGISKSQLGLWLGVE